MKSTPFVAVGRSNLLVIALAASFTFLLAPDSFGQGDSTELICDEVILESSSYYVQVLIDTQVAFDVNNPGVVVGAYGYDGAVYENLTYRSVEVPSATSTELWAINDSGLMGGRYSLPGVDGTSGFTLSDGVFSYFDYPGATRTIVAGISNNGDLAGGYFLTSPGWFQGFIKTVSGPYVSIEFPGADTTFVNSINTNLDAVGAWRVWSNQTNSQVTHGFIYSGGAMASIDVPGAAYTEAVEINDNGVVFGYFKMPDDSKGVFTKTGTGYQIQSHPLPSAAAYIGGWNDAGQIAGWVTCRIAPDLTYSETFGFLASPAIRVQIDVMPDRGSLDLAKKNPVMVALMSTPYFDATASADSVVLLPREWIWGSNDLEGGTPPLRHITIDINHDGLKDVLFHFPRHPLQIQTAYVTGIMLKGTTPDGDLFFGVKHLEILNQWPD